jgi:hypothetical protein
MRELEDGVAIGLDGLGQAALAVGVRLRWGRGGE